MKVKKLQEKVEKCRKDVDATRERYQQSLTDLNSYNAKYIEDMTEVFQRTQEFEHRRITFIKKILYDMLACVDLTQYKAWVIINYCTILWNIYVRKTAYPVRWGTVSPLVRVDWMFPSGPTLANRRPCSNLHQSQPPFPSPSPPSLSLSSFLPSPPRSGSLKTS